MIEKKNFAVTLVLLFLFVGMMSVPMQIHAAAQSPTVASGHVVTWTAGAASASAPQSARLPTHPATPAASTTFPRTVLIETFTGVWCPHCPAESQALYYLDGVTSHNVLSIAELHVCYDTSNCYENYVPPDGTSTQRGTFYNVCGFPDVFFDGLHSVCGATNNATQMLSWYDQNITTAESVPGNVSIAQSVSEASNNVTGQVNITSGLTGSYNAVSYLLEYIGKRNVSNGNGPHDLGNIVRETLYNHPVSLVAGQSTSIALSGGIATNWNQKNLSVVTFVQENSTKIIENANMVPVSSLGTTLTAAPATLASGANSTVTVHVSNLSTGDPVSGAAVTFSSSGGVVAPTSGVTGADGTLGTTFTAPSVSSIVPEYVSAQVTSGAEVGFATATITVMPYVPPTQPTGLTVTPTVAGVTLNWTAPSTGGGGVTYVVYQAVVPVISYVEVNVTTSTQYQVTGLTAAHSYSYKVEATDAGGSSPDSAAITANAVTGESRGLPTSIGWWVDIDSMNFSSPTSAALLLYLPDGVYGYTYGTSYYARVASDAAPAPVTVSGAPATFNVSFSPSLATLKGTVNPITASVTLNGTSVTVVNGVIDLQAIAGTYVLNVSTPGYEANATNVTLAPGNTTLVSVALVKAPASTPSVATSSNGLSNTELIALVAVGAIAVVAVVGAIVMMSRKGKGGNSPRTGTK